MSKQGVQEKPLLCALEKISHIIHSKHNIALIFKIKQLNKKHYQKVGKQISCKTGANLLLPHFIAIDIPFKSYTMLIIMTLHHMQRLSYCQ